MRRLFASFFFRIRDLMSQIDGFLACITTICCCYGLLLVATATYSFGTYKNLIVQFGGMMLGLIGIFFIMMIDVENLSSFAKFLYPLGIVLLAATLVLGTERLGNKNWIILGPISIQPSEFVKLIFIITFATHIQKVQHQINRPKAWIPLMLHFGILFGFVLLQGDLGTALVYLFIMVVMLIAAGLHWLYFAVGGAAVMVGAPFIFEYLLHRNQSGFVL